MDLSGSWYEVFIEQGPVGKTFRFQTYKTDFRKKSHEIGSIRCGPGIKYLSNTAQLVQYFVSKYSKWIFGKKSSELSNAEQKRMG